MEHLSQSQQIIENITINPENSLEIIKQQISLIEKSQLSNLAFLALKKLAENNNHDLFISFISKFTDFLTEVSGIQSAFNLIQRLEVALQLRKPHLAIYDHTFHIIGGGEKYGLTVANALQEDFDITIIANKPLSLQNIREWYNLNLDKCKIKIIPIPFFDNIGSLHLDPGRISKKTGNPFHIISKESGNYDFFVNNGMNEMIYPLSNVSMLICHFPERRPRSYFYADKYSYVIYNSEYTAHWVQKKWKFTPHKHIFPPVDMTPQANLPPKEQIILSVARFESGGSKKQMEMIRTFTKLRRRSPTLFKDWKLVLAGGSQEDNPYLEKIKSLLINNHLQNIELQVNIPIEKLESLYQKATIFWHLCGLDQTDPSLVEHFGMTIVEAMQNKLAPIVFDGGGQREIVEQGISGFRVRSTAELIQFTTKLIENPDLLKSMGQKAFQRSRIFNIDQFDKNVKHFFLTSLKSYISDPLLKKENRMNT
jgi:glycosyltransferase involved in cell wall biosynthesis